MRLGTLACVLWGCQEYGLGTKPDVGATVDTGSAPQTTPDTPTTPPATTPPGTTPPAGCEAFVEPAVRWVGSPPFTEADDPVDAGGLLFWEPAADVGGWVEVAIPDRDIPIGTDRAYVGTFSLASLPPNLSVSLQSDDGIWLWVNGVEVGHWGGAWQQEGCVNENARCLVTTTVPAVDVTPLLQLGDNVFAARVSNPVFDAWFEVLLSCRD
jgi:hypothetical protein